MQCSQFYVQIVVKMSNWCCCCRSSKAPSSDDDIELETMHNKTTMCRAGLHGNEVSLAIDNGNNYVTVKGVGIALGSCSLDCDTAYWEVRVGSQPQGLRVGVKRFNPKKPAKLTGNLDDAPSADEDSPAWCFKGPELKAGDVVGVYWDQTDLPMLSFSLNGDIIPEASILRIRPAIDIVPAVSCQQGSSCEMIFDGSSFIKPPKSSKFKMIISAKSLL
jgi:hypothetical protein